MSRPGRRMADGLKPGDPIDYTVTYLEMTERPRAPVPARPANVNTALVRAEEPPLEYFLYLYTTVGGPHEWTDWLEKSEEEVTEFIHRPGVFLYTLMVDGWPGGFFMLDGSEEGVCDLAYFGLVPQAIGRGLGRWLLATAVETGWEMPGTERMSVNTNTLDHPRALGMYQRIGFVPVRQERMTRTLTRERAV